MLQYLGINTDGKRSLTLTFPWVCFLPDNLSFIPSQQEHEGLRLRGAAKGEAEVRLRTPSIHSSVFKQPNSTALQSCFIVRSQVVRFGNISQMTWRQRKRLVWRLDPLKQARRREDTAPEECPSVTPYCQRVRSFLVSHCCLSSGCNPPCVTWLSHECKQAASGGVGPRSLWPETPRCFHYDQKWSLLLWNAFSVMSAVMTS